MLTDKEQLILLELLTHEKLSRKEFIKNTNLFCNDAYFFKKMKKLRTMGLLHGSAFWKLTFKGYIRAKLIALDGNNPKDYAKNLKKDVVLFEI